MEKLLQMKKLIILMLVSVFIVAGCGQETPVDETYETEQAKLNAEAVAPVVEDTKAEPAVTFKEVVYPYTFTDKFGNDQTIEAKPETYISFSPEITETLFALGVGDNLVGRSSYCDYPIEAFDVEDMGTLFDFSIEAVLAAEPDVVFLSSMVSEEVYQQLIDNGMVVAVFDYDTNLEGTKTQIEYIGDIVDKAKKAAYLNERIDDAVIKLTAKSVDREPKSLYFVVAAGDYTSTATGDTFIHDIIQTVGATNIAADATGWMYTVEQIVEADPEFIICSKKWDTKENLMSLEGYKDLSAVTEGKIYEIDENIFFRQGPRVVEAMYILDALLYEAN